MKNLITILLGFVVAGSVQAGGYRAATQGQQALSMGHAAVAMSESSETLFFNPGAMTEIEADTDISGGIFLLGTTTIYQNEQTNTEAETDNPLGTPISGYYVNRLSEELSWGLGIFTPFGNKVEWDTDWAGSHLVNYIELQTIYIQPTIAYRLSDAVSVGFGPNLVIGEVEFNRNLSTSLANSDGDRANVTISDSSVTAWGYNLGLHARINETLSLGFSYRNEVTLEARNGDADFENIPTALAALFPDGKFDADLVLPAELTIGLAWAINDVATLAFDINRTYWGAYDALTVEFEAPGAGTSVNLREYEDANIYRLGLQYRMDDDLTLRGGIYIDESPVQDGYFAPETPRNDSIGYTFGASYSVTPQMNVDFSLLLLVFDEIDNSYDYYVENGTTIPFEGTYETSAWSLGFGLNYRY